MSFSSKQYLEQYILDNKAKFQSPEQLQQLGEIQQLLQSNNIDALFNEVIVEVISKKPEDIKVGLIAALKKLKAGGRFFSEDDFGDMFENYNLFQERNNNQVYISNLVQSLRNLNIPLTEEELVQRYPQLKNTAYVGKKDFVELLQKEYIQHTTFA